MRLISSGLEVEVKTPNCTTLDAASSAKELTVSLGPEEVSFWDFVRQGWRRENVRPGSTSDEAIIADGWTSKSAPALRFRPSEYFDSRLACCTQYFPIPNHLDVCDVFAGKTYFSWTVRRSTSEGPWRYRFFQRGRWEGFEVRGVKDWIAPKNISGY